MLPGQKNQAGRFGPQLRFDETKTLAVLPPTRRFDSQKLELESAGVRKVGAKGAMNEHISPKKV
jgi:hypothetical protein